MSKKSGKKNRYSGLSKHKRQKSMLLTAMHDLPVSPIDWPRDWLPEYLWIELLSQYDKRNDWTALFHALLDKLQAAAPVGTYFFGLISDFGTIPAEKRSDFVNANEDLVLDSFYKPAANLLRLYPEFPGAWLCDERFARYAPPPKHDDAVRLLSDSVARLLPAKDLHAGHIRIFPFVRLLKSGKLFFQRDMVDVDVFTRYPNRCTEDERYKVQQFSRTNFNAVACREPRYSGRTWPQHFWRYNLDLVKCSQVQYPIRSGDAIEGPAAEEIANVLAKNAETAVKHLQKVSREYRYDIYAPERDEILLGLFSRLTRLYWRLAKDLTLWSRDFAGVILRCLVDTAITFSYLAKQGTPAEFREFMSYGQGKLKLLMLHLQDTYPDGLSMEGMGPENLADQLGGGFSPELLDIELGNWTKKSARELAFAAGLEKQYRLVYDPASADIHGTWMSLANSNLTWCAQPLHRYHRIPGIYEPPVYLETLSACQEIYDQCLEVGKGLLRFPGLDEEMARLPTVPVKPAETPD